MNTTTKSLLQIHTSVFLFGLSGLFGKLLNLSPLLIVLGRVFFSSLFLLIVIFYLKDHIVLRKRQHYFYLLIMGIILAIHWCTFFESIQISTVAIALITFSTFPVFVTFLEPYLFNEKITLSNIILAVLTFLGVVLVIPKFELGNNLTQGVVWGIASGFSYAILSLLNRKYVQEYSSPVIAFYQQSAATIILLPSLFLENDPIQFNDLLLLIILGTIFTGISHTLFINGLKNIKTQTAGIISSLEPVYGIIFSIIILQEFPSFREILGGIIILSTVFYSTIKNK